MNDSRYLHLSNVNETAKLIPSCMFIDGDSAE